MHLQDLLQILRSGNLLLAPFYEEESGQILFHLLFPYGMAEAQYHQVMQSLHEHQAAIFYLARLNDAAVCSDPGLHAASYVPAEAFGEHYTRCEECAKWRAEQAAQAAQEGRPRVHLSAFADG
jgi:hypothetical protein